MKKPADTKKIVKPILAIETSSEKCSVAVVWDKDRYIETSSKIQYSHSKKIFKLIEHVLSDADENLGNMKSIAISIGPGSFTGLRIGLAAAKGMALGTNLPLIPVPTFETIAFEALEYTTEGEKFFVANKVSKEEIYFAGFLNLGNIYKFEHNLAILPINELEKYRNDGRIFGNGGDGTLVAPSAKSVALLGKQLLDSERIVDYKFLEPMYVKEFIVKGSK